MEAKKGIHYQIKLVGWDEYKAKLELAVKQAAEVANLIEELNSATIGYEIVKDPLEESR